MIHIKIQYKFNFSSYTPHSRIKSEICDFNSSKSNNKVRSNLFYSPLLDPVFTQLGPVSL